MVTCPKCVSSGPLFYSSFRPSTYQCGGCSYSWDTLAGDYQHVWDRSKEGWDEGALAALLYEPTVLDAEFWPVCKDCGCDMEKATEDLWGCYYCFEAGCLCYLGHAPCGFCETLVADA